MTSAAQTEGQLVARAQLEAFQNYPHAPALLKTLGDAKDPRLLSRALASEQRPGFPRLPGTLRSAHAEALGISQADLDYRALYPGLDIGIYACSHSMGKPSVVGPAAVIDQLHQLSTQGIQVWEEGIWVEVMDQYRAACAQLVGGNLEQGDVAWFPNVSEALHAVLEGFNGGKLVYTAGHFTTGHYVHHQWSQNTGGQLIEVPCNADGSVPTERLLAAITADTTVVSISHALFESGWLQDLPAIAAHIKAVAPDALLLVDAYQTAGTVPLNALELGDHVAFTTGGHKQLRSSAGASFVYLPRRWMHLSPRRTGWWGHAAPFAFEKGPVRRANDASRFRSGTPGLVGMAMLLGELRALAASAGGDIGAAVQRARQQTSFLVDTLLAACQNQGLPVRGDWPSARRGAFVCIEIPDGKICEALAKTGIITDFRPRYAGARDGWLRVSGNSAGFAYEMEAVVAAVAEQVRLQ